MTSLKDTSVSPNKVITWPQQLIRPEELVQAMRQKSRLCLIKSPICSKVVLQIVGGWAYLLANVLNKSRVFHMETFNQELRRIEAQANTELDTTSAAKKAPLLTLSNHISCIDDPLLWASLLPLTYYSTHTDSVRWSPAAVEICFSKSWHSTIFSLGKTFPIVRGAGINQPALDFALALLECNQWLHLFPEGRVMRDEQQQVISNRERGYIFKWGISKIILDYFSEELQKMRASEKKSLRILPFYHLGLDQVLPIGWPYIPRIGKQTTIFMRPTVIEMNANLLRVILSKQTMCNQSIKSRDNDTLKLIRLTNYFEEEMEKLIEPATNLHKSEP